MARVPAVSSRRVPGIGRRDFTAMTAVGEPCHTRSATAPIASTARAAWAVTPITTRS